MRKTRRTGIDKLHTLLFGQDLRITEGEPYCQVRPFDFAADFEPRHLTKPLPVPAGEVFDIRTFGADPAAEDNAVAVQQAVDAAAKVGGTVLVDGGCYPMSTVELRSGVTLFITPGSFLAARTDGKGFRHKALLYGRDLTNVTLTGGGGLEGEGHRFGLRPALPQNCTKPANLIDVIEMRRTYRAQLRFAHPSKYGGLLCLEQCQGVHIHHFLFQNSAHWTCRLQMCRNVRIEYAAIRNNRNVANADGFDIVGGQDLIFRHCMVSTADDGFVFKHAVWLGSSGEMRHILVEDCRIDSRTNCIKIGTETTYPITDVTVRRCRLELQDLYPGAVSGISVEACDGSVVSQVHFEDMEMIRCTCPIFVRLGNRNRAATVTAESANAVEFGAKKQPGGTVDKHRFDGKSAVRDITFNRITAREAEIPIILAGYRQQGRTHRVERVTLRDVQITYANRPEIVDRRLFIPEYVRTYPEGWRFRNLPSYGIWARHTRDLCCSHVTVFHPRYTQRPFRILQDCPGARLTDTYGESQGLFGTDKENG